jgi:hypothetical protein
MAAFESFLSDAYGESYRGGVPNAADCSGFVIAAAAKLGITLPNVQADALLGVLDATWEKLGTGPGGLARAREAAASGRFVIVGASSLELKDSNGHVAVVLDREEQGWPVLFGGGSPGARSEGTKGLNFVFKREFHAALRYYAPRFDLTWLARAYGPAVREQLGKGIAAPTHTVIPPRTRLCRFTDVGYGPNEGLVSPWWIAESDFLKIVAAREHSREAHGGDKRRALSLGFLARWAVAIPQEWQGNGRSTPTTMDLLLRADVKVPLHAFRGRGRAQREVSPNGIDITWTGWASVTQYFIPQFSRLPNVGASLSDVMRVLEVGAPTHVKSTPLYRR